MAVTAAAQPWRWYSASPPIAQARRRISGGQVNALPRTTDGATIVPFDGSFLRASLRDRDGIATLLQGAAPRRLVVYAVLVPPRERYSVLSRLGIYRRDNLGRLR
jgi:hypothetical protein